MPVQIKVFRESFEAELHGRTKPEIIIFGQIEFF
jgi:hypothetical protein